MDFWGRAEGSLKGLLLVLLMLIQLAPLVNRFVRLCCCFKTCKAYLTRDDSGINAEGEREFCVHDGKQCVFQTTSKSLIIARFRDGKIGGSIFCKCNLKPRGSPHLLPSPKSVTVFQRSFWWTRFRASDDGLEAKLATDSRMVGWSVIHHAPLPFPEWLVPETGLGRCTPPTL